MYELNERIFQSPIRSGLVEAGLVFNVNHRRWFLGLSQISDMMHKGYFQNDFYLERTLELNKPELDDFCDEFIDKIRDEAGV